ncbi:MAG: hypothetical protein RJA44_2354 [Pseudomonadota bacterium]
MSLLPLDPELLRLHRRLPFGLHDSEGRLLLAPGESVDDDGRLRALLLQPLHVDDFEAAPWLAQLAPAPVRTAAPAPLAATLLPLRAQAELIITQLADALRAAGSDPFWLNRMLQNLALAEGFEQAHGDTLEFLLLQHAAHSVDEYSTHHALLCALLCHRVGARLGWSPQEQATLVRAAMTMNVSMIHLQDQLARQSGPLRPEQRARIERHAEHAAVLLADAGVSDQLWLDVVRLHDDPMLAERPLAGLSDAQRLARLLRLVDRFAAKISRRGNRHPLPPLIAVREACTGVDGQPDDYGAALLDALGPYPPGSYVRLSGREIGVVRQRQGRPEDLLVVVFEPAAQGLQLRDTTQAGCAVLGALPVAEVARPPEPDQVLQLLLA